MKNIEREIILENERSGHVEKLVNELSTFKFFQYIYAHNMFKMFGLNLLMILFAAPLIYLYYNYAVDLSATMSTLPSQGSIGLGFSFWSGLDAYSTATSNALSAKFWLWAILGISALSFAVSGGICVIRDSFWTGKLNVIKIFFKGIYQCGLVVFVGFAVLGVCLYGLIMLSMSSLSPALSTILQIVAWIAFVLLALYMFILFSVVATYKQNFAVSMVSAGKIFKKFFVSSVFNFLIALIPIYLILLFAGGTLFIFIIVLLAMVGMFYIALVWQCHMMKIFSIYHPIEKKVVKRKKQYQ